jgi:hypothetical protein
VDDDDDDMATSSAASDLEVVVHPLVLLSVVDHFRRCDEVRGEGTIAR